MVDCFIVCIHHHFSSLGICGVDCWNNLSRWRRSGPKPFHRVFPSGSNKSYMPVRHSHLPPTAPPPDLRRLLRVPRYEKLWNYVTWPAWENSNVFLFNWCLYSSEISDCKSPLPDEYTTIFCFTHTPHLTATPFRFRVWRPVTGCLLQI